MNKLIQKTLRPDTVTLYYHTENLLIHMLKIYIKFIKRLCVLGFGNEHPGVYVPDEEMDDS